MINLPSAHHIWRSLRFVAYHATHAGGLQLTLTIVGLLFALAFFVIGLTRVVEFGDLGFGPLKRWTFIVLHVLGVTLFACAMVLFGADSGRSQLAMTSWLMLPGLAILLPLHIYVNVIRRVRYGDILTQARKKA